MGKSRPRKARKLHISVVGSEEDEAGENAIAQPDQESERESTDVVTAAHASHGDSNVEKHNEKHNQSEEALYQSWEDEHELVVHDMTDEPPELELEVDREDIDTNSSISTHDIADEIKTMEKNNGTNKEATLPETEPGNDTESPDDVSGPSGWQRDGYLTSKIEQDLMTRQEIRSIKRTFKKSVSAAEKETIAANYTPRGPPTKTPVSYAQEYTRKFRWPVHPKRRRFTNFDCDPEEVFEEYELETKVSQKHNSKYYNSQAFAGPAAPLLSSAVSHAKQSQMNSGKRGQLRSRSQDGSVNYESLMTAVKLSEKDTDQFVRAILSDVANKLQGDNSDNYPQDCWNPLPQSGKPIANWRFILKHTDRWLEGGGKKDGKLLPRMSQATLKRVQDRLRILFDVPSSSEFDKQLFGLNDHVDEYV